MKIPCELSAAKRSRNTQIRADFDTLMKRNISLQFAMLTLMNRYGLSNGTLWAIINRYGYYRDK